MKFVHLLAMYITVLSHCQNNGGMNLYLYISQQTILNLEYMSTCYRKSVTKLLLLFKSF